ncbi:MAG: hypothetical protein DCC55_18375 [Chloroflexi bacterium]|nr:MAG: hypothetical protein DCC55_18375 [Chloroflexota bacterium]
MHYTRLSEITDIEVIARGRGVDDRRRLNRIYGRGTWRKLKGRAVIEYTNGEIWLAELHWYEASNSGRREEKDKRRLRRLT